MQSATDYNEIETRQRFLNTRLEEFGWAVFLILLGVLWIMPEGYFTSTAWLAGAGIILLGMNFIRFYFGIKMSGFTVFLGVVALLAGFVSGFGVELPIIPAVLLVLGFSLLMRAAFRRDG